MWINVQVLCWPVLYGDVASVCKIYLKLVNLMFM